MRTLTYTGEWTAVADELPDDDMVVLVALDDGEVWSAYHQGERWYYVTADPIIAATVLYWTDMLPSPIEAPDRPLTVGELEAMSAAKDEVKARERQP